MTKEQYQLQRSIAEKILVEEEEEYRLFLDIPDGPPTSDCIRAPRVRSVLNGKSVWSLDEKNHLQSCKFCKIIVESRQQRLKEVIPLSDQLSTKSQAHTTFPFSIRINWPNLNEAKSKLRSFKWDRVFSASSKWKKISLAATSFVIVGFVGAIVFRSTWNESQFPAISLLEKDSQYLRGEGVRSTNTDGFPISPKATAIRQNLPTFRWTQKGQIQARLQIYISPKNDKSMQLFASQSVTGDSWKAKVEIPSGIYYWYLQDTPNKKAFFQVLSAEEVSEIQGQEKKAANDRELAAIYLRHHLFAEAKPILQRLYARTKDKKLIPYLELVANSE